MGVGYQKFLGELEKQQEVLAGISDVISEVFAMESALLRSEKTPTEAMSDMVAVLAARRHGPHRSLREKRAGRVFRRRRPAHQHGRPPPLRQVRARGRHRAAPQDRRKVARRRPLRCLARRIIAAGRPARVGQVDVGGDSKARWRYLPDAIRQLLADNVDDQSIHMQVFATLRYLLRQRLAIGRPVTYVDATHLTPGERRPYALIAEWYGCDLEAVFFDVPADVCMEGGIGAGSGSSPKK